MSWTGSRQGDFSRGPATRGYSGVLLQQGRVQLDSDWNEQALVQAEMYRAALRDLIGPHGGPAGRAGFGITPIFVLRFDRDDQALVEHASHGTDGVRVELVFDADTAGMLVEIGHVASPIITARITADRTLHLGGTALVDAPPFAPLPLPADGPARLTISIRDDQCTVGLGEQECCVPAPAPIPPRASIRLGAPTDPAHGPGFIGSVRSVRLWQWAVDAQSGAFDWRPVHHHDIAQHVQSDERLPALGVRDFAISSGRYYIDGIACEARPAQTFATQSDLPGAQFAPGPDETVHIFYLDVWEQTVTAIQDPDLLEVALGGADTTVRTRTVAQVRSVAIGDHDDVGDRWRAFAAHLASHGRLRARRRPGSSAAPVANALYRIEIHSVGDGGTPATIKWSRNNGATCYPLRPIAEPGSIARLGEVRARTIDLAPGDWVELLDDDLILQQRPGQLIQIGDVDPDSLAITFAGVANALTGAHPFLRRWDHGESNGVLIDGAVAAPHGRWIDLENGIQVQLGQTVPNTGDYWMVPARAATGSIGWPGPPGEARPPDGVAHLYAPLAVLRIEGEGCEIADLRRFFGDIVHAGLVPDAPHHRPEPVVPCDPPARGSELPVGAMVLTAAAEPLAGFVATGQIVETQARAAGWEVVASAPCDGAGPLQAVRRGAGAVAATADGATLEFDVASASFERLPDLPGDPRSASLCGGGDAVHLIGGIDDQGYADPGGCWRLRAGESEWAPFAAPPVSIERAAAAATADHLYVGGGVRRWWFLRWATRRVWQWDGDAAGWIEAPRLPAAVTDAAMAGDGEALILAGGARRRFSWLWATPSRDVWRLDRLDGRWRARGRLDRANVAPALVVAGHDMFVLDRARDSTVRHRFVDGDRWHVLPHLPDIASGWALVALEDRLWAFGLGDGQIVACALTLRERLHVQRWVGAEA